MALHKVNLSGHIHPVGVAVNSKLYDSIQKYHTNNLKKVPIDDVLHILGTVYTKPNSNDFVCLVVHIMNRTYDSIAYTGIVCGKNELIDNICKYYAHHFDCRKGMIEYDTKHTHFNRGRMPPRPRYGEFILHDVADKIKFINW